MYDVRSSFLPRGKRKMDKFFASERGSVNILSATMMVVVLSFTGLAIDVGVWVERRDELQTIADSASTAGAKELSEHGEEGARAAAMAYVKQRGENLDLFQFTIDPGASTVKVTATDKLPRYLSVFLLRDDPKTRIEFIAKYMRNRKLCALAMDPAAQPGVSVSRRRGTHRPDVRGMVQLREAEVIQCRESDQCLLGQNVRGRRRNESFEWHGLAATLGRL